MKRGTWPVRTAPFLAPAKFDERPAGLATRGL